MQNEENLIGYLVSAVGAIGAGVYAWATWSLRRWTRDEIRGALETHDRSRKRESDRALDERRRFVDKQLEEAKREAREQADELERNFANAVAALERRDRDKDRQLQRMERDLVETRTNYEHLSRDHWNFRHRIEGGQGGQVKIFGHRSPARREDEGNGDEST